MHETNNLVVREESVLEKHENGVLVQRITIVNGQVIRKEEFPNGTN